jgi:YD repeat-containing protein
LLWNFLLLSGAAASPLKAPAAVTPATTAGSPVRTPGTSQQRHGAAAASAGKLISRYTTAYSDTYQLPDGHMLTRVFAQPVNSRASDGGWQAIPASSEPTANAAMAAPAARGTEAELACTIQSATPTSTECNAATLQAGFVNNGSEPSDTSTRGLLQFPLPNLHNNVTVLKSELELYETASTTTTGVKMGAYPLTTAWGKGATWDTTNGSTPWHTPGGDFETAPEPPYAENASVGTAKGWVYWYPTRFLQEWLNGTTAPNGEGKANLGLLLKDIGEVESTNVVSFSGHGQTDYPGLNFEWIERSAGNATNYTMLPVATSKSTSIKVNAASGNLMVQSTDLSVASKSLGFSVARTFNSLSPSQPGYGSGWLDHNTPYLQVGPAGGAGKNGGAAYTDPTGNTFDFLNNSPRPVGIEALLCHEKEGLSGCPRETLPYEAKFELLYLNTNEEIFFGAAAGVKNYPIAVRKGKEVETAHYTKGLERPTSWTDSAGETITYTESATEGYTKVEAKKEPVTYTEKADTEKLYKLTEVTNASKETTTYSYGTGAEEGLPTKITEPNGSVVDITYNAEKQAASIEQIASGQKTGPKTTYTYYEAGKAPSPCTATQKATLVVEATVSLIYCSNVLDEVEYVGYPETGQPGRYNLEEVRYSASGMVAVNVASGNLVVENEDVGPTEAGTGVRLDRFYNSQAASENDGLGAKWTWDSGPQVYLTNLGGAVVLHGPTGYVATFKRESPTTFRAPEEFEGSLTENANGTYIVAGTDEATYQFNSEGQMTSYSNEEAETFNVTNETVSGHAVLEALKPTSGAGVSVAYNGTGQVTQVTSPAGGKAKYEFNNSGQLATYTNSSGEGTTYEYEEHGYLDKITAPGTTVAIKETGGKVEEVTVTPQGEEAYGEKFTYETPLEPTCVPGRDSGETVVTQIPGAESEPPQTYCYNSIGTITAYSNGEEAGEEPGEKGSPEIEPIPAETCRANPYFPSGHCGEGELPPEYETEEGSDPKELAHNDYGLSDDNLFRKYTVEGKEEQEGHDIFTNPLFQHLEVVKMRLTIPWNLVTEAQNGPPSEERTRAERELGEVDTWITEVKKLTDKSGEAGEPLISLDRCHAKGESWYNPDYNEGLKLTKGPTEQEVEESTETYHCTEPPSPRQYMLAVKAMLAITPFIEVKAFTAWDEPNLKKAKAGHPTEGELVWGEPKTTKIESGKTPEYADGKLAGEYWNMFSELCKQKNEAEEARKKQEEADKKNPAGLKLCVVAAGDFSDLWMDNAAKTGGPGGQEFLGYTAGMGDAEKVVRWAWHSYKDGKLAGQEKFHHPSEWWEAFRNFRHAVEIIDSKEGLPKAPEIWLTEQGVVFGEEPEGAPKKELTSKGKEDQKVSEQIMDAWLEYPENNGEHQLTRLAGGKGPRITRYYYYEMRGAPEFDSGLLRVNGQPRKIYYLYRRKTPGCEKYKGTCT